MHGCALGCEGSVASESGWNRPWADVHCRVTLGSLNPSLRVFAGFLSLQGSPALRLPPGFPRATPGPPSLGRSQTRPFSDSPMTLVLPPWPARLSRPTKPIRVGTPTLSLSQSRISHCRQACIGLCCMMGEPHRVPFQCIGTKTTDRRLHLR